MDAQFVSGIREFNRFYTNVLGLLNDRLWKSRFSLPECRILYELGQHRATTAKQLMHDLNIDRGYLSRILSTFERKRIVSRRQSKTDGRTFFLYLTPAGKKAYNLINSDSKRQIGRLIEKLTSHEKKQLLQHMRGIEQLLESTT